MAELEYNGHCDNKDCDKKGVAIIFPVAPDKVEEWRNEPPTCTGCGSFLQGDVYNLATYDDIM